MNPDTLVLLYGLFLLVGAFFGWRAGSKVSLIMGSASGALIVAGWTQATSSPKAAYGFVSVVAVILAIAFLVRLFKTKKFMPAGMLLIVTVLFLFFSITHWNTLAS